MFRNQADRHVSAIALPGVVALEQLGRQASARRNVDVLLDQPFPRGRLLANRHRSRRGSATGAADLASGANKRLSVCRFRTQLSV